MASIKLTPKTKCLEHTIFAHWFNFNSTLYMYAKLALAIHMHSLKNLFISINKITFYSICQNNRWHPYTQNKIYKKAFNKKIHPQIYSNFQCPKTSILCNYYIIFLIIAAKVSDNIHRIIKKPYICQILPWSKHMYST